MEMLFKVVCGIALLLVRFDSARSLSHDVLQHLVPNTEMAQRLRSGEPIGLNVSLTISAIEIDDIRQVIGLSCDFHQIWYDFDLRYLDGTISDVVLQGDHSAAVKKHLWLPDIDVANGLASTKRQSYDVIRIKKNGEVTWTQRMYIEFPCEMDFQSYPLDEHECDLQLQSAGYFEDELVPIWFSGYEIEWDEEDTRITPRYELLRIEHTWDTVPSRPRVKRQLVATFCFESISGWTTKHTVLPFVAAVTTAYLAFFIDPKDVCTRILICGIAMIMASIFHESTYKITPRPYYTMGIEIFTGACLTFIWLAAVETVIVDFLSKLGRCGGNEHPSLVPDDEDKPNPPPVAVWVDRVFRFIYPAGFIAFNAVHWIIYS